MPKTGFADIDGAQIYYEVAGDGPPLVMVHAGIADSRMWDDQFPLLAGRCKAVRYDARGFGQSQPAAGTFAHHETLHALLNHLDIDSAILMGCSLGGMTALDFALAYPQRVSALILVGSGLGGYEAPDELEEEDPPEWIEAVQAFEAGDYERAAEMEVRLWVDGPGRTPDQVDSAVRDKVRAMNTIALRNEALNLGETLKLDPPAITRLHEISVPTLVIVGDHDQPEIIDIAAILADRIVGAQQVVMTNTAHVPNMEHPAVFNQHLLDFLNGLTL